MAWCSVIYTPYDWLNKFYGFYMVAVVGIVSGRNGSIYVTGFGKTDHIITIDISRNTDLKHRSHHGSLVLDCSHARFAV